MMSTGTVYVAMSGGVDSSVAAALLKKRGFRVVGVFMKPWQEPGIKCLWEEDREDALRVASVLNIPLKTWDFSREYGRKVVRYMIGGYRRGITPNPDVMCNKEIKFGLFFKRAVKEGADYIATGHYAGIKPRRGRAISFGLYTAKDKNKDQSYFLWTLSQGILSRCIFPVGGYTKPEVRKLAKKFGLPNHDKKDSQGVCFVGPMDVKGFLARRIKPRPGPVKHVDGRVLGKHDGASFYTIGQRHGLDLGIAGGPYLIVRKDMRKNIVYVGDERDILGGKARIADIQWVHGAPQTFPLAVKAKIRYRTPAADALLHKNGTLVFKKPQRAVTPGQSAVFYRGQELLGGGIIA